MFILSIHIDILIYSYQESFSVSESTFSAREMMESTSSGSESSISILSPEGFLIMKQGNATSFSHTLDHHQ